MVEETHENHIYLLGRPPIDATIGFLKYQSLDDRNTEIKQLAEEWRKANDHVKQLIKTEDGVCDTVEVKDISESPSVQKIYKNPSFHRNFEFFPTELKIVELDKLVVFQKTVNIDFVEILKKRLPPSPTEDDIFDFCFEPHKYAPKVNYNRLPPSIVGNNIQYGIQFSTISNDFRFLNGDIIDFSQITTHNAPGVPQNVIGLFVGYGVGYVNAISVNKRLILNNGMNRAYTLRSLGVKYMPCLIQKVSREEGYQIAFPQYVSEEVRKECIESPRPPLLKDFFDENLMRRIKMSTKIRLVTVTWQKSEGDFPIGGL